MPWLDQFSCIRQDLNDKLDNGNIPAPKFTIVYEIPTCYAASGYSISRIYIYNGMVAVEYGKPSASSTMGILNHERPAGFSAIP